MWLDTPMNSRYPAPHAEQIWSDEARARRMRYATDAYTGTAIRRGLLGSETPPWAESAIDTLQGAPDPLVSAWRHHEEDYGHEIVGFLAAYLDRLPADLHPYVHYGLTSSDLVEFDLHESIYAHGMHVNRLVQDFSRSLSALSKQYQDLPRAGRTHGQTAEATTLGHQFKVFAYSVARCRPHVPMTPVKSPGPTGWSDEVLTPLGDEIPSTQIVPRDFLQRWASSYLILSNTLETMAMFVRTGSRSEIGELQEGGASRRQGSSAMPGKRNPIQSEKVCGLARVARGYFLSIIEVSGLWEDRDLSNSSTERIAVPGLAATVEHMLLATRDIFDNLVVDQERIRSNSEDPRCHANRLQREIQRTKRVGPIEASRLATKEGKI